MSEAAARSVGSGHARREARVAAQRSSTDVLGAGSDAAGAHASLSYLQARLRNNCS
jgi:hypothetical protein